MVVNIYTCYDDDGTHIMQGDDCEYLHEYDMTKMPECYFFSKYGECSNKDCQYLHIDPNSKVIIPQPLF